MAITLTAGEADVKEIENGILKAASQFYNGDFKSQDKRYLLLFHLGPLTRGHHVTQESFDISLSAGPKDSPQSNRHVQHCPSAPSAIQAIKIAFLSPRSLYPGQPRPHGRVLAVHCGRGSFRRSYGCLNKA